jgi:hypothetical protein
MTTPPIFQKSEKTKLRLAIDSLFSDYIPGMIVGAGLVAGQTQLWFGLHWAIWIAISITSGWVLKPLTNLIIEKLLAQIGITK